ncbi:SAM-dependent methyltransferase [Legionella geestiana]|uniref:Ribosomal RNA small subunit methyltransferase J n=1 Tax=Legionella geestiana TaxID=45065 RepID=A0A0W0TP94_9GAMM|nr:class I SAM-dependent methyltransferase [Legionella geestiana]KTC97396.1 SAM-dependent methyltransferase [Legionella geestiana]STX53932.1 N6-adenine-specific methylase [Legionella geestiana]
MLSIGFESEAFAEQAEMLGKRLGLEVDNVHEPRLCIGESGLSLKFPGFSPVFADFEKSRRRVLHNRGGQDALIRACRPAPGVRIVDATAGWGRDAAVLASLGAQVTMIEQNPVMHALLEDALQRSSLQENLSLVQGEAGEWLTQLESEVPPDVIYLDPMHPVRQKSALVQKDMQILQQLVNKQPNPHAVLAIAISRAKRSVVVKWPQKSPPLAEPTSRIPGKTVRFDVYAGLGRMLIKE